MMKRTERAEGVEFVRLCAAPGALLALSAILWYPEARGKYMRGTAPGAVMAKAEARRIRVGTVEELRRRGCLVLGGNAHPIAVFWHDGRPWALDNRCPHMGFALSRGSLADGLLTCHWHHARFDLVSGGTLDPFADDVTTYPTVVEGADVFVDIGTDGPGSVASGYARLRQALETSLPLVLAKSIFVLSGHGVESKEIVSLGARFGVRHRAAGWGAGLTTLTALANILPSLGVDERPLALFHGLIRVAEDCAGQPPRFDLPPLSTRILPLARLKAWFREAVEVRDEDASERVLRTAIESGTSPRAVADLLFAAATDHCFLDGGHTLDFIGKAFELLDLLGWEEASSILPSLVGNLCRATRSEELGAWRRPVDLPALITPALERLPELVGDPSREGRLLSTSEFDDVVATLLGDAPEAAVSCLLDALAGGVALMELGQAVAHAATLRVARFSRRNDFGDWDTVHNTFTSCHALHQALGRAPSRELARALFHAAMRLHLERFLNVPPVRMPDEEPGISPNGPPDILLELLDRAQQVDAAGRLVDGFLSRGGDDGPLLRCLALAVLREDTRFHTYQALEGGLRQYEALRTRHPLAARRALLALARFAAAHAPSSRTLYQTYQVALRLQRGEDLTNAAD